MKIKNGRIDDEGLSDNEIVFRKQFRDTLKNWYGLALYDIPEVMEKIGIRSKNYEIIPSPRFSSDSTCILVKTKNTVYEVEMFRGNMINPYSHFKVTNKGKEKFYSVKKVIQVEEIE